MQKNWAKAYLNFLSRNKTSLHIFLFILCSLAAFCASKLTLKTDFATLLPDTLPSVINAKELSTRIGGTGLLVIGIVSPSFEANRTFAEALAPKLDTLVGSELRYFEYRFDEVRDYIYRYGLHYLNTEQLRSFKNSLQNEINKKKDKAFSNFLGFDEETSQEESESPIDEVTESIDPSLKKLLSYQDAYLSSEKGKVLAFALQPLGASLGVNNNQKLISKIQGFVNDLSPKEYHSEMQVAFSGNVQQSVEEFQTIKSDILDTAILLIALTLGLLILFFWSFRVIFLLIIHLLIAVLLTFGITKLHIGYLNSQTAFLASLVVGTGINYGIILISRFLELCRNGLTVDNALEEAVRSTVKATLIASSTTAVSFLSLLYNDNKGLSQFAFIGGVGVALCWSMAFTFLPLWMQMLYSKSQTLQERRHPFASLGIKITDSLGYRLVKNPAYFGFLFFGLTSIAIFGVVKLYKNPIEYNFDKVRTKLAISEETLNLRKRINSVFSTNLNPSIILVNHEKDAKEICPAFYSLKEKLSEEDDILESCQSVYNFYAKHWPQSETTQRLKLLREIQKISSSESLQLSNHAEILRGIAENLSYTPPKNNEVPEQLLRRFREQDGRLGLYAFISPDSSKPINDGRNLLKFTSSMSNMQLSTGTKVSAAGNSFIFADLLEGIKRDGIPVSLIALVGVLSMCFLLSGGIKSSLFMGLCLCLGAFWMLGLQGSYSIKYNFFNFIALPLTFGIGVDYPINVYLRCKQEGFKNIKKIMRGSGSAVILCSLTTTIGYYTLLSAASQALSSFAKIAIMGEIACLIIAILFVPWTLAFFRGRFKDVLQEQKSNLLHKETQSENRL